ncbi:MAG: PAS domain S-box protein [Flavisolibacter sp.]
MFSLLELTPDLVCIADKAGYFKRINQSVIDTLEYSEAELFASPIATFIHPDDKNLTRRKRARLLAGEALINFENRYVAKSGKVVWLHWTSIYFPDKEVVLAIAKNVTEKKRAEKEIEEKYNKFKSLATHFKSSLEKDRKYLAVELHEELAQLASVVKMDINWIQDNSPDLPDASKTRIDHALAVSELLINAMRRISFSMSPNMLEDLGLNETLEWLCKEFAILNGIPCVFESRCDEELLSYETQLDFFRICQEALKNIMTHAEATAVKVCVELTNDKICLSVTDDGKGFELKENVDAPGLTNMRERAASINGQLDIKTEAGKGTRICITVAQ